MEKMKDKKEMKTIKATTEKTSTGELVAIASTEAVDRAGDSLKVTDWDFRNFLANPVLQAGHDYRPQFTIGVAKNLRVENGKVLFTPVFHNITPLAKQISEMYDQGFLKAWSVGFIPGWDSGDKNELLEVSAVAVPANQEALTFMKSLEGTMHKAVDEYGKEDIISNIKSWTSKELEEPSEDDQDEDETDTEEVEDTKAVEVPAPEATPATEKGISAEHMMAIQDCFGSMKKSMTDAVDAHCKMMMDHFMDAEGEADPNQQDTTLLSQNTFDTKIAKLKTAIKDFQLAKKEGRTLSTSTVATLTSIWNSLEAASDALEALLGINDGDEEGEDTTDETNPVYQPVTSDTNGSNVTRSIRWNKTLSKSFDVESVPSKPATFQLEIYSKFLECQVKNIFVNNYAIPMPLLGSYLGGFKSVLGALDLTDTRNFAYDGTEYPPQFEVIQLNSTKSQEFLIDGTQYYKAKDGTLKAVITFRPTWDGLSVSIATSKTQTTQNKQILADVKEWVAENNYLKGESFSLNGEFLAKGEGNWNELVLDPTIKDAVGKTVKYFNTKGVTGNSRGLMFVGPPGTGKTKSGRVLLKEAKGTFIWVSAKDLQYYYSSRGIGLAFDMARSLAPCVLFFEDIDTWLGDSATDLMKTEMDGLKQNKGVITVLTSNNPNQLPDALLDRPGRFHDVLQFGLPNADQRGAMLKLWAGDLDEEVFKQVVDQSEGYSGAHVKELVEFAQMVVDDEGIAMGDALIKSLNKLKTQRDLIDSIRGKSIESKTAVQEKTVEIQDTPQAQKGGTSKGRDPLEAEKSPAKPAMVSSDEIILRAMQKIAGQASQAILTIKQKKDK